MTKKPILIEVYAWNETILGLYALAWAIFVMLFRVEGALLSGRTTLGGFVAGGGVALLLVQDERLRTFLDFTVPRYALKWSPPFLRPFFLRLWPASTLVRISTHFFFTVWWLLMGLAISLHIDDLADVRLLAYFAIALLHFDRLLRLIQWMRR